MAISKKESSINRGSDVWLPHEMDTDERLKAEDVAAALGNDAVSIGAFCVAMLEAVEDHRGADFLNGYFVSRMS